MATEYIVSKNMNNDLGIIGLSTTVFELIAKSALEDFPQLKVAKSKNFRKMIVCKVIKNTISIKVNLRAANGTNISEACQNAQEKIHEAIVQMTGFRDVVVDVNIVGFYF